jgi:hypothetical protein
MKQSSASYLFDKALFFCPKDSLHQIAIQNWQTFCMINQQNLLTPANRLKTLSKVFPRARKTRSNCQLYYKQAYLYEE